MFSPVCAPHSNQPLWVGVLMPNDAAPGEYTGTITISAAGIRPHRVPIQLTIWDFTSPQTPSMRTHFGDADVNPLVSRPPQITAWRGLDEAGPRALQTAYAELMAAHRICPPIPGDIILWCVRWYLRFPISFAHMAEMALWRLNVVCSKEGLIRG
jgi:hypothetical protein